MFSNKTVLIVDDEQHCVEVLEYELRRLDLGVTNIYSTTSSEEAIELISQVKPQLTFLDIDMPIYNGFDVVQLAPQIGQFIVTTAYEKYAIQAFKAHAINFLLKPVNKQELTLALKHYLKLESKHAVQADDLARCQFEYLSSRKMTSVVVPDSNGLNICKIDDIYALSADGSYTAFIMKENKLTSSKNIGYYEDCLPADRFMRIHRKYIINLTKVSRLEKSEGGVIELTNGASYPVSRQRMRALKDHFGL